jgi:hypothetical protein
VDELIRARQIVTRIGSYPRVVNRLDQSYEMNNIGGKVTELKCRWADVHILMVSVIAF